MEATLKGIKGVESAKVSFKDKQAVVVLDETKTPLSDRVTQLPQSIQASPYGLVTRHS